MNKAKRTSKMVPLIKKAEKALQSAARKVWEEHRIKGLPIYIWKNNRVVRIPASCIPTRQ